MCDVVDLKKQKGITLNFGDRMQLIVNYNQDGSIDICSGILLPTTLEILPISSNKIRLKVKVN